MASALSAPAATASDPARTATAARIVPAVLAMLLGLFVVGVTGFSHIEAVHNAAHDTRHSSGFPCH